MRLTELLAVFLFLAMVVTVYLAAVVLLVRAVRRRVRRADGPSRRERWAQRIVIPLAVVGLLCMAYGRFVEPYWLDVTHHRIVSPKLPPGTPPIRIVHISDLHSDPTPRLEERLPEVIAEQKPDLVVFTGDAANSPDGLPTFKRCLTRIAAIAPTYAVKGNWDLRSWSPPDLVEGTGGRELDAEAVTATVRGVDLWIGGVWDWHQLDVVLPQAPDDRFSILLYHYPVGAYKVADHGIDLYCCGHTHGGQVALPFYGALITLSHYGKRFEAGRYQVEDTTLYVNRGIGMEGSMPRVRFCARPEVAVFDIVPAD
jgi:hypothetical protein